MTLIDTNIFMYAAGRPHRNRDSCIAFLGSVASGEVEAAVDAEVLQEVLHRYRAIGRWSDGKRVYDLVRRIVPVVIPVTAAALDVARDLLDEHDHLTARDALHAAVYEVNDAQAFCSFDRDFDRISGLIRVTPDAVC